MAAVVLKVTVLLALVVLKFVPVMVTTDVTGPVTGENEVTVVADQDNGAIASAILPRNRRIRDREFRTIDDFNIKRPQKYKRGNAPNRA